MIFESRDEKGMIVFNSMLFFTLSFSGVYLSNNCETFLGANRIRRKGYNIYHQRNIVEIFIALINKLSYSLKFIVLNC